MSEPEQARQGAVEALAAFVRRHPRLVVISGAGCSTASGIGDYRDSAGRWKHAQPIQYADFMAQASARRRYWARSMLGWPQFSEAQPNPAHKALVHLESAGRVVGLITQNVDRLHQQAGQRQVLDLHGRLDRVRCQSCGRLIARAVLQERLLAVNGALIEELKARLAAEAEEERAALAREGRSPAPAADGDARLTRIHDDFAVPTCDVCDGVLKPDVVFYGQSVPKAWVQRAYDWVAAADGLLVVGSSLMVFSSFRFCRAASQAGTPIAILNQGVTRADELAQLKLNEPCGGVLSDLVETLGLV